MKKFISLILLTMALMGCAVNNQNIKPQNIKSIKPIGSTIPNNINKNKFAWTNLTALTEKGEITEVPVMIYREEVEVQPQKTQDTAKGGYKSLIEPKKEVKEELQYFVVLPPEKGKENLIPPPTPEPKKDNWLERNGKLLLYYSFWSILAASGWVYFKFFKKKPQTKVTLK